MESRGMVLAVPGSAGSPVKHTTKATAKAASLGIHPKVNMDAGNLSELDRELEVAMITVETY